MRCLVPFAHAAQAQFRVLSMRPKITASPFSFCFILPTRHAEALPAPPMRGTSRKAQCEEAWRLLCQRQA